MTAPTLDSAMAFRRCRDARHRSVGREGIVVRQSVGEVLVVNEVGTRVLDLLESGRSAADVVASLAAEYDVDAAALERDVLAYLRELLDAGVIEAAAA